MYIHYNKCDGLQADVAHLPVKPCGSLYDVLLGFRFAQFGGGRLGKVLPDTGNQCWAPTRVSDRVTA